MAEKENNLNKKRWVSLGFWSKLEEEIPYDKCPRCGSWRYRMIRKKFYSRFMEDRFRFIHWHECKECLYREDT